MKTSSEIRLALIEKAGEDEQFRARLMADPKSVIQSEFGLAVPEGFNLNVHEESPESAHIVLPPNPGLTTEQMMAAAGGGADDNVQFDSDSSDDYIDY